MVFAEIGKLERALHSSGQRRNIARAADRAFYLSLLFLGALLWWASHYHASLMPVWGPWEFSWAWFLATALALWWYGRGLLLMPQSERPAIWRTVAYFAGIIVIYAVLQTHFEYLAQHMFFLNRVQQAVMHDLGPVLVALAWPGAVIYRGMPRLLRRLGGATLTQRIIRMFKQPLLASVLFVGVVALWLVPTNSLPRHVGSEALSGDELEHGGRRSSVLDARARSASKASRFPVLRRPAAMAAAVMLPQTMIGAIITFAPHDLYTFYDWCGRVYPRLSALKTSSSEASLSGFRLR